MALTSASPNERDQNMSCFEGLEMGLNLEVLRPEVDALGRWWRSYRYQEPVRFVRSRFILYRIHRDQITLHISMYILCCSGKIVYILLRCQSLCIFGRVRWRCLSGVSCSLFDLMV